MRTLRLAELRPPFYRAALFAWLVQAITAPAAAQPWAGSTLWTSGGLPVVVAPGGQGKSPVGPGLAMLPDGAGGAFLAWVDNSIGRVVVQRLDAAGRSLWPAGGVPIADTPGLQYAPALVSEDTGGIIVAWVEGRSGWCGPTSFSECDVYAQRLTASGVSTWAADGVPLVTAPANQGITGLALVADGSGGAIAVWEDARPPNCCRYFAQRIDAAGSPTWEVDGVPVSPPVSIIIGPIGAAPVAVSDGTGGALVGYLDNQHDPVSDRARFAVQRIGGDGTLQWPGHGLELGAPAYEDFGEIATDGAGGAIVAWAARVAGTVPHDVIRTQRISPAGHELWTPGGILLADAIGTKRDIDLAADDAGGAVMVWEDDRHGLPGACFGLVGNCDIYAQRVSGSGLAVWSPGGVPVTTAPNTQQAPRLAVIQDGGAVIVWQDCRDYPDLDGCAFGMDLYAQRLTGDGQKRWPGGDLVVSDAPGNQGVGLGTPWYPSPRIVPDGTGGAIVAWPDGRHAFCQDLVPLCDVYAQRTGEQPAPRPPLPSNLTARVDGGAVELTWNPPLGATVTGYVVEAGSVPGASDLAAIPTGSTAPQMSAAAPPGRYHVRVRAVLAGGILTGPSNEIVVIAGCPSAPPAPTALAVTLAGSAVAFAWAPPPGLSVGYTLEAGSAPGLADLARIALPYRVEAYGASAPVGTYYVRLRSVNSCGTGPPSAELIVNVGSSEPLPAAPADLTAAVAGGVVSLEWSPPPGSIVGYQIEAGSAPASANLATIRTGAATAFATPAPPGVYYVRVRAISAAGTGAASADIQIAVP